MRESQIEQYLVDEVKKADGLAIKLLASYFAGIPDRLILLPGAKVYFVELKRPGEKPRKVQLYVHDILEGLGFTVLTIDTKEKVNDFITFATA